MVMRKSGEKKRHTMFWDYRFYYLKKKFYLFFNIYERDFLMRLPFIRLLFYNNIHINIIFFIFRWKGTAENLIKVIRNVSLRSHWLTLRAHILCPSFHSEIYNFNFFHSKRFFQRKCVSLNGTLSGVI